MSTIYLHIGTPKTGTTAIQNFMAENGKALEAKGICYADLGMRYPRVGVHRNGHFLVAKRYDEEGNRLREQEENEYTACMKRLEELGKAYPRIVLSDEGIWMGCKGQEDFWNKIKQDFEARGLNVKIIVYLRRQDLWVQSHWAQKVKEGATYDFHEYLNMPVFTNYLLDYYNYLEQLSHVFGKEALIVRVYEKGQYRGKEKTIQSDFLYILDCAMSEGFVLEQDVYNTSLKGDYLEMRKILNALPEFKNNSHLLVQTIKAVQEKRLTMDAEMKTTLFHPGEQQEFLGKYAISNRKVAMEYLRRPDGVLFYRGIKELPERQIDDGKLLRDTICVYGEMTEILLQKNAVLEEKNKELKAEIQACKARDKELKEMIRDLQQTALLFRLRRKTRHILGKNRQEAE